MLIKYYLKDLPNQQWEKDHYFNKSLICNFFLSRGHYLELINGVDINNFIMLRDIGYYELEANDEFDKPDTLDNDRIVLLGMMLEWCNTVEELELIKETCLTCD